MNLIGLDLDDVVLDFAEHLQRVLNLSRAGNGSIEIPVHLHEVNAFISKFNVEHTHSAIMLGGQSTLEALAAIHAHTSAPLLFVTARSECCRPQVNQWLEKHLDGYPFDVHFTGYLSKLPTVKRLGIRYFVDDSYINVENVAQYCRRAFLFDGPHNQHVNKFPSNVTRVKTLWDVLNYIKHNRESA